MRRTKKWLALLLAVSMVSSGFTNAGIRVQAQENTEVTETVAEGETAFQVLLSNTVLRSFSAGDVVGTISVSETAPEGTYSYSLCEGEGSTDNSKFVIEGNQLKLATDLGEAESYSVRVKATAGAENTVTETVVELTTIKQIFKKENVEIASGTPLDLSGESYAQQLLTMEEGTIMVEYTSNSSYGIQSLFSIGNNAANYKDYHLHVYITPAGVLGVEIRNGDAYAFSKAGAVISGQKNSVALVADKENATYKLFANKELVLTIDATEKGGYRFAKNITGADTVSVGATMRVGSAAYSFGGTIHKVAVYDTVLTDDEAAGKVAIPMPGKVEEPGELPPPPMGSAITEMYNENYADNSWVFVGGDAVNGGFAQTRGVRNYIGHFEEYIRWTMVTGSNWHQRMRYTFNNGKAGRTLADIVENYDTYVTAFHPKAAAYMVGKEDYSAGTAGVAEFKANLKQFIDKSLALKANDKGFAVIQKPYATKDNATNTMIEAYCTAVDEVVASYQTETAKYKRIVVVDHYTQTNTDDFKTNKLQEDNTLNVQGHLEIGRQLAAVAYGSSNNYPSSRYPVTLDSVEEVQPESYLSVLPNVTATEDGLSVVVPEGNGTAWKYIVEMDDVTVEGTADENTFTISGLTAGADYILKLQSQDGKKQLTTVKGKITAGNTAVKNMQELSAVQQKIADKVANKEEAMTWLFIGDSITHASGLTYGYAGLTQLFEKYVRDELGRTDDVILNTGVADGTTRATVDEMEQRVAYDADVVMIMLGTNDMHYLHRVNNNLTIEEYEQNLQLIVNKIREMNKDSIIVFRTPTPANDVNRSPYIEAYNEVIKRVQEANENTIYVDQYTEWNKVFQDYSWAFNAGKNQLFGDIVHPAINGHLIMYRYLVKGLGLWTEDSTLNNLFYEMPFTKETSAVVPALNTASNTIAVSVAELKDASGMAVGSVTIKATGENGQSYSLTAETGEKYAILRNLPNQTYQVEVSSYLTNVQKHVTFAAQEVTITEDKKLNFDISLDNTVLRKFTADVKVGALSVGELAPEGTYTYLLCEDEGSTNNDLFKIEGNQLKTAAELTNGKTYSVRVKAVSGSNEAEKVLRIKTESVVQIFQKENLTITEGAPIDLTSEDYAQQLMSMEEGSIVVEFESNSSSTVNSLISIGNKAAAAKHFHLYAQSGGVLGVEIRNGDSYVFKAPGVIKTGEKNTVALVADKESETYKLYANGELVLTVDAATLGGYRFANTITDADNVTLGATLRNNNSIQYTFGGTIHKIAVYDTVLTDEEATGKVDFDYEAPTQVNIAVSEGDGVPAALPAGKSYFTDSVLTANGINDRYTVSAEDTAFVKNKNSFTISFDFKTSSTGLMSLGGINSSDHKDNYISFYVSGNRLGMEIRNYNGTTVNTHKYVDVPNVTLADNNWHTVTYVISANNSYQIYLDQEQVMNATANPTHFTGTAGWWDVTSVSIAGINRISGANSYPYTGSIRNVKMYGEALSADQISLQHGKILQKTYFSTAQTFDGTVEGLYVAAKTDLPFVKDLKSGTLVASFKTTNTGKQTIVSLDSTVDGKYIDLYIDGTTVGVDANGVDVLKKTGLSTTVADGKWHTLIYRVEAQTGFELYLDGALLASKEDAAAAFMTSGWGDPAAITFGGHNGANLFNGSLKNVKIFTGAISQEQLNKEQGSVEVNNPAYVYEDNSIVDEKSMVDINIDAEEISEFTKASFSFAYALEESAKTSADKLPLFSLSNNDGTKYGTIYIQPSTQTIGFDVKGGNSGEVTLTGNASMQNTEFHTVTLVFNGTEASVYFDGALCGKKTTAVEVLQGNDWTATKATLGGIQNTDAATFCGYLDTAYVYAGVLTQEQIAELHTSQIALTAVLKTEEKGLFDRGDYNSQGYRIPALLTTNKGTLIAAIDKRNTTLSDCGNINTVIRRSTDGGKTWDDSITVVDLKSQPYDEWNKSCVMIDPCLIQSESGRIWMLVDMFPEGKAALGFMDSNFKTAGGNGYVTAEDGKKYQGLYETVNGEDVLAGTLRGSRMYDLEGKPTDYTIDMGTNLDGYHTKGDMYHNGEYVGNIYLHDQGAGNDSAPYHIYNTMYVWLTYSDDDGLTWSNPVDLTGMVKADWMKFFGAGPGVGLEVKNGEHKGRLVFPVYYTNDTGVKGQFGHQSSACIYSDDGGVTWQCSESPNDGRINSSGQVTDSKNPSGISQLTESQIVELNNGHLLIFMRNTGGTGKVAVARSTDGGATWEDPYDTNATEVYCQLSVIHYPELVDGKEIVVMSNPGGPGGRKNGTLRIGEIGEDDRVTWVTENMFCPSSYYAYSCLSYIKDGEIGLVYETLGDTIKYTSFNLEYIRQGISDMSPHITEVTKTIIRNGQEIANSSEVAVAGDILRFTVTIDQDVLVKGNPTFRFWLNGHTGQDKYADFVGYGVEDNQVVFEYEVQKSDRGHMNFMGPKIISDANNYVRSRENYQVTATNLQVNLGSIGVSTDVQADMDKEVDVTITNTMSVTVGSHQGAESADKLYDNNASTIWHTEYNPAGGNNRDKHWVLFDLGTTKPVTGVRYLPRQSGTNGKITKYEIQVSTDGTAYTKVAEGTWDTDNTWKWAKLDEVKNVRYVKVIALDTVSDAGKTFASAAEMHITVAEAHEHTYGNDWEYNADGHYQVCATVEGCPEKTNMAAHNFGAYTVVKKATCTTAGEQSRTCEDCGYVEITEVAAGGHKFGPWKQMIVPSEGVRGVSRRICENCNTYEEEYSDYVAPEVHEHDYDTANWMYDATNHWHKCKAEDCTSIIDSAAHTWDAGKVTVEATATNPGKKTFTCTICPATRTEEIPATGGEQGGEKPGETPGGDQGGEKPGETPTPTPQPEKKPVAKGKTFITNKVTYKVTKSAAKNGEVSYVKSLNKSATTITVPKTVTYNGFTYKVTAIEKGAFKKNTKIKKVVIGDNVKTIGASAFEGCTKITNVTIGKNVTKIGDKAFKGCKALKKVTIPAKVTSIGKEAFQNCSKLSTIIIKSTRLNKVGKNAFKGIKSNAKIDVPNKQLKKYKTLLKNKGQSKNVKIK